MNKDAVIMMRISEGDKEKLLAKAKKLGFSLAELIRFAFYNYKAGYIKFKLLPDKVMTNDKGTAYLVRVDSKLRNEMKKECKKLGLTLSRFTRTLAKQEILGK